MKNFTNQVIIISNGSGGIATFQSNLINFFNSKKIDTVLIDKKSNHTKKNIKKTKHVKFLYAKPLKNLFKTLTHLWSLNKVERQKIIIISNPAIYIIYIFFLKIFLKKKKIFLVMHGHILNNYLKQIIICFTTSVLSILADNIFFVSNFTKEWWKKFFPIIRLSNYKVNHNFLDINEFLKRKNTSSFNIAFVGRFEKEKGILRFINIAQELSNIKNLTFSAYGSGTFEKYMKTNTKIKVYAWDDTKKFYNRIHILLITSPVENCPYVLLEAKSNAIPTINLSEGGVKEILRNNYDGILLKKDATINKILISIKKIINNYKKYQKNCKKSSLKFHIKNFSYFLS